MRVVTVKFSVKMDRDLIHLIESEARRLGVSKSEVIRRALRKYFYSTNERRVIVTRKMKIYL